MSNPAPAITVTNPHREGSRAAQVWPYKGATAAYEAMVARMVVKP